MQLAALVALAPAMTSTSCHIDSIGISPGTPDGSTSLGDAGTPSSGDDAGSGTVPGDGTDPGDVTPSAASLASRSEGVAPLAVFFDAADPASGVLQPANRDGHPDYATFDYRWSFGDGSAGAWQTTGRSKNAARGFEAAHVYETPGVYTATLTVTDDGGAVHTYEQQVVVRAFSGTTYYVAASGNDGNAGTSESAPLRSFGAAASRVGPNTRILFRRGDTFATSGAMGLDPDGPGIVGAYGSGPAPVIRVDSADAGFRFGGADWRLVDLHVIGPVTDQYSDPNGSGVSESGGIEGNTTWGTRDALMLRVEVERFRVGILWSQWQEAFHRNVFIVDSYVHDVPINGMYVGGTHLAIIGTRVEDIGLSHGVRVWQGHRSVLADDVIHRSGGDRPALKFHAPNAASTWPTSQDTVIWGNDFMGHISVVSLETQNAQEDERVSDILFAGNTIRTMDDSYELLTLHSRRVTVRNNLFLVTSGQNGIAMVNVSQRGIEPVPEGNRIYNNTARVTGGMSDVSFCTIQDIAYDNVVQNNLLSAPGISPVRMISGGGKSLAEDHNLVQADPGFVNPGAGDFDLEPGSPAIDKGADTTCPYDRMGRPRIDDPQTPNAATPYDIGAYEYQGG